LVIEISLYYDVRSEKHQINCTSCLLILATLFSSLGEEHILRIFECRVMIKMFGPMTDKVKGRWRKLHNEQLHV